MATIIPAIIPNSLAHLVETLELVAPFTHTVQIDIVDGKFVPFTSWPYHEGDSFDEFRACVAGFDVEIDLMVQEPEMVIESYLKAGVSQVVVHLESTNNLAAIIAYKEQYNFKLGFSINNDTELSALDLVIESADYVQLMGIAKIGSQGQPFDTRVLTRIAELKSMHPELMVSIDGSVNAESLPPLIQAGANRFVAGSSILAQEDPRVAYDALCRM